jgi:hypothetical protein
VDQLSNIKQAWDANKDTPSKMRELMQEYGITMGDLSQATGETFTQLDSWVKGGDILGAVGFSVNRPGAYDKYKAQTTREYEADPTFVTGASTPESRLESFQSSQRRAENTFDPLAYEKYKQLVTAGVPQIEAFTQSGLQNQLYSSNPVEAKQELLKRFGVTKDKTEPTSEEILSGFKFAKDSGLSEKILKQNLGDDLYNQYRGQLKSFATTSINDIVADNSLTFAESANVAKLARDLGFNSQQLADMTGKDKSLFDTILTNYDANRDIVIKDTLSGPNILTDADRIVASYALQNEFGFNDDDIARATGVDVNTIKNNLSPVRNFQDDFSKIANNTDSTTQQLKDFVLNAKSNAAIDKLYGESLTGYENKIAELEQKWGRFGSDPVQSENLFQQLNAQKNALGGEYYQGVFGDLENSAAQLVNKGLDTLGDLGKKDKFQTNLAEVRYTSNGENLFSPDGVSFFKIDGDNGQYIPVDPKNVQTTYGKYVDDGFGGMNYENLSEAELATVKDGTYQEKIGSVVIDKDTGKELTGLDGNLLFQRSGGHIKTKKNYLALNADEEHWNLTCRSVFNCYCFHFLPFR